jgi:hypothetical protein
VIDLAELRRRIAAAGSLRCPECTTPLEPNPLLPKLAGVDVEPPALVVDEPATAAPKLEPVAPPRPARVWPAALASGAIGALAMLAAVWWLRGSAPADRVAPAIAASAQHWVEGDYVIAEGRAIATTGPLASHAARVAAQRGVIAVIESQLPSFAKAFPASAGDREIVASFDAQLAGRVRVEGRGESTRALGAGIEVTARVAMSRADVAVAVAFYSARRSVWGLELANAPPALPPGVIVIAGARNGSIAVGDRLVAADRLRMTSLDAVTPELASRAQLELVIERPQRSTIVMRSGN